jgi:hypothetical protein
MHSINTRRSETITPAFGGTSTESKTMNAHNACLCLPRVSADDLEENAEGRRGASAKTQRVGMPERRARDVRTGWGRERSGSIRIRGHRSKVLIRLAARVCKGKGMRHRLGVVGLELAVGTSRDM